MILTTERLIVQEFTEHDAPFMLELLNTPSFIKYIGDRGVRTVDEAKTYLKNSAIKSYQENGHGAWLVRLKDVGTSIGLGGLIRREGLEYVDLGFAFLPDYESKGYGFESSTAVLEYGWKHLNTEKVLAITTQQNFASQKLLKKLGFNFKQLIVLSADPEKLMLFEIINPAINAQQNQK